jgi:peptidoglycan/LPS O-acetylase OafA/YrhL
MERRERRRHEKGEKSEKGEKHEKEEKMEKGGSGMGGALVGGLVLIWLGIAVYLQQTGTFSSNDWSAYFLVGLGLILVADGLLRSMQGSRAFTGLIIGGAVLVLIGATVVQSSWQSFWPLILVIIGVAVIVGGFSARRRSPSP